MPKAKLDVAGTIRAQRFLIVKPTSLGSDSKTQTVNWALATDAADSIQPLDIGRGHAEPACQVDGQCRHAG